MSRLPILLILLLSASQYAYPQFLTLPDLALICTSTDLDATNKYLKEKSWSLAESEVDDENGLKYDSWAYGISSSEYYDEYTTMAPGYLNLLSREGNIVGVYYTVFEYDLYNTLFTTMKENGFRKYSDKNLKRDGITAWSDGELLLIYNIEDTFDKESNEHAYSSYTAYMIKKSSGGTPGESGPRKEYYEGGELRAEYTLSNGKPEGAVKLYDRQGFIVQESNYRNGLLHGERRFYYPSVDNNTGLPIEEAGKLYLVSNYSEGIEHGTETWYYQTVYRPFPCVTTDSAGIARQDTCRQLIITKGLEIINYKKGSLHGKYELYDESGALVSKGRYKNGMETGKWFRKPGEDDLPD